jgi:hypothetical protein
MTDATSATPSAFESLDDSKINRFQMKIMVVSGMGFFTDAYDLFVIGIVVKILKDQWHLSTTQVSLLSSLTLAASTSVGTRYDPQVTPESSVRRAIGEIDRCEKTIRRIGSTA